MRVNTKAQFDKMTIASGKTVLQFVLDQDETGEIPDLSQMTGKVRFSDVPTVKLQAHVEGYDYHTLMPTEFPDAIVMENDGDIFDGSYVSKRYVQQRTCHFVDRDEDGNPAAYRDGFCDRCGEEMDDADLFCPNCGAEVVDE